MLTLSDISASPLFWQALWPVMAFALLVILCLISFAWFSRGGRSTDPGNL